MGKARCQKTKGGVLNELAPASSPSKLGLFRRFAPTVDLRRPDDWTAKAVHWPQALSVRLQSVSTAARHFNRNRTHPKQKTPGLTLALYIVRPQETFRTFARVRETSRLWPLRAFALTTGSFSLATFSSPPIPFSGLLLRNARGVVHRSDREIFGRRGRFVLPIPRGSYISIIMNDCKLVNYLGGIFLLTL